MAILIILVQAGNKIQVFQTTVLNNRIYAAAGQYGILWADLLSPNLVDYNEWTQFNGNYCQGIVNHNGQIATISYSDLFRFSNGAPSLLASSSGRFSDLRSVGNTLVATAPSNVFVYNEAFVQTGHVTFIPDHAVTFTAATVINDKLYIGTKEEGVFATFLNNGMVYDNITPDGPQRSKIFSLEKTTNFLWVAYGEYTSNYNPFPLDYFGISKLTPAGWETIPNDALDNAASIVDIVTNPNNQNQLYAASYHSGLLEIENDELVNLYDYQNTGNNGLESLVDPTHPENKSVRINCLAYDSDGNLWMTNSRRDKFLKERKAGGQWASYNFSEITSNNLRDDYSKMVIDRNDTKWIGTNKNGVVAFNEKLSNKSIVIDLQNGNLPSNSVKSLAIDNNNRLWIGTINGLRIISSVERFTTENTLTASSIIIEEDGVAQELMYEQTITDIEVDGSNNKWLGTTAGAFLISPDGQRTLFHFTKENSPLPSNVINDIAIDQATGEVFFATDKGMVSYKGTSTAAAGDLSKVFIYPNPVRPGFIDDVKISGLIDNANVKITDIEGNLVYETTSEGGTVLWDTTAFGRYRVATGVYMVFISSEDGTETKVKKVMIIR